MARKLTRPTLGWILTGLVVLAGYWIYQNHLSSDVKRILTAACDESTVSSNAGQSLETARSLARTRKDKKVLKQFEHIIELRKDVVEFDAHIWDRLDADLRDLEPAIPTPLHHLLAMRAEYLQKHSPVPSSLQEQIDRATQEQQAETSRRHRQEQIDKQRTDQERQEIPILYNAIRSELGLSPVASKP